MYSEYDKTYIVKDPEKIPDPNQTQLQKEVTNDLAEIKEEFEELLVELRGYMARLYNLENVTAQAKHIMDRLDALTTIKVKAFDEEKIEEEKIE